MSVKTPKMRHFLLRDIIFYANLTKVFSIGESQIENRRKHMTERWIWRGQHTKPTPQAQIN